MPRTSEVPARHSSGLEWAIQDPQPRTDMIDCIVGYHLNPWTCGIAKFNAILARQLEVPVIGFVDYPEGRHGGRCCR